MQHQHLVPLVRGLREDRARPTEAAAAFRKLLDAGAVRPEERTVLVMTGTGLKSTPRFAELLGVPL